MLVQCNYGYFARRALWIAGAPVGQEMASTDLPCFVRPVAKPVVPYERCGTPAAATATIGDTRERDGSIIVVVATDAPLLPHQLKRLAKRPSLGLGRLGSIAANGSGDIFIAFSTANPELRSVGGAAPQPIAMLPNDRLSPLFEAVTQATEEAVVNAMVAARTMEGADGLRVHGLSHQRLRQILARYNRLNPAR